MSEKQPNAAFIIIGNEILSGRTQDKNLNYLATVLVKHGIKFSEVRVIPDIEEVIVNTVNELRAKFDSVFTSGGIGPTHDDITSGSIAKAFGIELELNDEAVKRMLKHYENPEDFNDSRKKMAMIPVGATLIDNPISAAPGFIYENVYVMAGVPSIFRAMIDSTVPTLKGGDPILAVSVSTHITEGNVADGLGKIQDEFDDVDIGSYPYMRNGRLGTSLVVRGTNQDSLESAKNKIVEMIVAAGGEAFEEQDL